ncbi:MAG: hypothetical protein KY410_05425, partial [Proteobacteria bacterium]|nr:hypothetical protein [Pseudomonadota bacterium]
MKKNLVSLVLAAAMLSFSDANAASDGQWGVFGFASDIDGADTGMGGGIFGRTNYVGDVYFTGHVLVATYDDVDRGQLLLGGEWVDRQKKLLGYVGMQAGVESVSGPTDETDGFARVYYDIGLRYSKGFELRIGVAVDTMLDSFERQW